MTKEMRVKAMGRVIAAADKYKKDKAALGDAVREIVDQLQTEESVNRGAAQAENEANLAKKRGVESND